MNLCGTGYDPIFYWERLVPVLAPAIILDCIHP